MRHRGKSDTANSYPKIENILTHWSVAPAESNNEKKVKNRAGLSLKALSIHSTIFGGGGRAAQTKDGFKELRKNNIV